MNIETRVLVLAVSSIVVAGCGQPEATNGGDTTEEVRAQSFVLTDSLDEERATLATEDDGDVALSLLDGDGSSRVQVRVDENGSTFLNLSSGENGSTDLYLSSGEESENTIIISVDENRASLDLMALGESVDLRADEDRGEIILSVLGGLTALRPPAGRTVVLP